jgi:phage shock protein C
MKKLYLSNSDKKISGVLGGIAEYFNVDSTMIRVAFLFIFLITGLVPGIIFYFLAAMIMPKKTASV